MTDVALGARAPVTATVSIRALLASGLLVGLTEDVEDVAAAIRAHATQLQLTEDGRYVQQALCPASLRCAAPLPCAVLPRIPALRCPASLRCPAPPPFFPIPLPLSLPCPAQRSFRCQRA